MKDIRLKDLCAYYREELPPDQVQIVEKFLTENKDYLVILKGLQEIEHTLPAEMTLKDYLAKKKEELRKKIFRDYS